MRTLVAAPIARHKLYSLGQWAAATKGHDRLMVVEEEESDIVGVINEAGIPALTYTPPEEDGTEIFHHRFTTKKYNAAYETIIKFAESFDFSHILSLQSDNIPPDGVDIVEVMWEHWDDGVDFLVHLNPWRPSYGRPEAKGFEMGCTMASTVTWRRVLSSLPKTAPLYWAIYQTKEKNPKFNVTQKLIDVVELQHLEE